MLSISTARVFVNGVEVGALPTDQYNDIVKEAHRKKSLYIQQLVNGVMVALRISFTWLALTILLGLIVALWTAIFEPKTVELLIQNFHISTPADIARAVQSVVIMGSIMATVIIPVMVSGGMLNTGYANQFDSFISSRLRKLLEVPAKGPVNVHFFRVENNVDGTTTTYFDSGWHDGK